MKNPTLKDAIVRVGGFFAAVLAAILIAKAFFPGHESAAIFIVSGLAFSGLVVHSILHKFNPPQPKRDQKRKRN